jgi:hypothetical protein
MELVRWLTVAPVCDRNRGRRTWRDPSSRVSDGGSAEIFRTPRCAGRTRACRAAPAPPHRRAGRAKTRSPSDCG